MTIGLYADFKKLPLKNVSVRLSHRKIHVRDCDSCDTQVSMLDHIDRAITLEGPLDDEQRKRLMEIADKCPVHRTLQSKININTLAAARTVEVADNLQALCDCHRDPQHGGGGASTSLGLIAFRPSPQVNLLKSIGPSVAFSPCAQRLRLQKSS